MDLVNVHDAKTNFSRLLARVAEGEEIVLAKAGKPVAKLVPVPPKVERRSPGSAKGKILASDDFEAPLPKEVQEAFE